MIGIDQSKAFNSICHNILLAGLKAYGATILPYNGFDQSYLSGRSQRVKCNEVSDWLALRCGVPQGSLLGPLFVNDGFCK